MSDLNKLALAIGSALAGAVIGYFLRRTEHLREQRIDAYRLLLAGFASSAHTGATLLSIHQSTGYPHEMNRKSTSSEDIEASSKAHNDAWTVAGTRREEFELAAAGAEMVAGRKLLASIDELRMFLEDALYSGRPWLLSQDYPSANLAPAAIEAAALKLISSFSASAARELWRRSVPGVARRSKVTAVKSDA